ncbi:MAG: hypothetical protein ACR2OZ_01780 [Verrucomicrobiales bacterium]
MTRNEAIERIQEACKQIALQMMRIHPAVPGLGDEPTQAALLKAAHQLTVELETIKKLVIRLQNRDDNTAL